MRNSTLPFFRVNSAVALMEIIHDFSVDPSPIQGPGMSLILPDKSHIRRNWAPTMRPIVGMDGLSSWKLPSWASRWEPGCAHALDLPRCVRERRARKVRRPLSRHQQPHPPPPRHCGPPRLLLLGIGCARSTIGRSLWPPWRVGLFPPSPRRSLSHSRRILTGPPRRCAARGSPPPFRSPRLVLPPPFPPPCRACVASTHAGARGRARRAPPPADAAGPTPARGGGGRRRGIDDRRSARSRVHVDCMLDSQALCCVHMIDQRDKLEPIAIGFQLNV